MSAGHRACDKGFHGKMRCALGNYFSLPMTQFGEHWLSFETRWRADIILGFAMPDEINGFHLGILQYKFPVFVYHLLRTVFEMRGHGNSYSSRIHSTRSRTGSPVAPSARLSPGAAIMRGTISMCTHGVFSSTKWARNTAPSIVPP